MSGDGAGSKIFDVGGAVRAGTFEVFQTGLLLILFRCDFGSLDLGRLLAQHGFVQVDRIHA